MMSELKLYNPEIEDENRRRVTVKVYGDSELDCMITATELELKIRKVKKTASGKWVGYCKYYLED
jgi:hypothetical protein